MQSPAAKIFIVLILLALVGGGVGLWWFIAPHTPATTVGTFPGQSPDNGPDNTPITPGGTTVVTPGQGSQTSSTTQPAQTVGGIEGSYANLFTQLLATAVPFKSVNSHATGDLKALYGLYAFDIKAQQAAYPQATTSIDMALVDLTDDGKPEALVYEDLPYFCGTGGCTLDVYQKSGTKWTKIFSELTTGNIGLANVLVNGHLDLYLTRQIEGNSNASVVVRYRWDGSAYAPKGTVAVWDGSTFRLTQ